MRNGGNRWAHESPHLRHAHDSLGVFAAEVFRRRPDCFKNRFPRRFRTDVPEFHRAGGFLNPEQNGQGLSGGTDEKFRRILLPLRRCSITEGRNLVLNPSAHAVVDFRYGENFPASWRILFLRCEVLPADFAAEREGMSFQTFQQFFTDDPCASARFIPALFLFRNGDGNISIPDVCERISLQLFYPEGKLFSEHAAQREFCQKQNSKYFSNFHNATSQR